MTLRSASTADRDRNAIRSAGLDKSFWSSHMHNQLSPFLFALESFYFLFNFLFLSRFPSYIEGNVEFKCGDGNCRLGCLVESVLSHKNKKMNKKK